MIFLTDNLKKNGSITDDKEEGIMAVAKPSTRAFMLNSEKVGQFVKKNDASEKALKRFRAHKPKNGVSAPFKEKNV